MTIRPATSSLMSQDFSVYDGPVRIAVLRQYHGSEGFQQMAGLELTKEQLAEAARLIAKCPKVKGGIA